MSWILLLIFNVILLAPMMVAALRRSDLALVLATAEQQWLWSITAIVAVEWLAGAAMVAYALLDENREGDPISDLLVRLSGAPRPSFLSGAEPAEMEPNGTESHGRRRHAETDSSLRVPSRGGYG